MKRRMQSVSRIYARAFPPERQKNLRRIFRYDMFEVMFYRPDLWLHSHRVSWLIEDLAPLAQKYLKKFDTEKSALIGFVHDDAEMITGDVQAGHKAVMTMRELRKIERDEAAAIEMLAKRYPRNIGPYAYRELLCEALYHSSIEAQVSDYADKLDGFSESMHEVLAGNISFVRSLLFYQKRMTEFPMKYPRLAQFLRHRRAPLIDLDMRRDHYFAPKKNYVVFGKPFTRKSLTQPTDFPFYNRWRTLTITHWGEKGLRALMTQKEFL